MLEACAIVCDRNKGWILDRIAHEVMKYVPGEIAITYVPGDVPRAKIYFVTHYSLALPTHNQVILFTHPSEHFPVEKKVLDLKSARKVICLSGDMREYLEKFGINNIQIVPEGTDKEMFKPHDRKNGKILICSRFYERKNKDLMEAVVSTLERFEFIIIGSNWPHTVTNLPNVQYYPNLDYDHFPEKYAECDIFFSAAKLEGGGPNALIEAMSCNMVPVISNTGNAKEYVFNGYNGFVFQHGAKVELIAHLFEKARQIKTKVNETVDIFTWEMFGKSIAGYLSPSQTYQEVKQ